MQGAKPPVIQGRIEVVELSMGKIVSRESNGRGYSRNDGPAHRLLCFYV